MKTIVQYLKEEIKKSAKIHKDIKSKYRFNQSKISKGLEHECVSIPVYPTSVESLFWKKEHYILKDETYHYNIKYDMEWKIPDHIICSKNRLTKLHIAYNMLRNKKQHCHNEEKETEYAEYAKEYIQALEERMALDQEEKQHADV